MEHSRLDLRDIKTSSMGLKEKKETRLTEVRVSRTTCERSTAEDTSMCVFWGRTGTIDNRVLGMLAYKYMTDFGTLCTFRG